MLDTEVVTKIVREASKSRLESFLNIKNVQFEDVAQSELVYQPWMILIFVSGKMLRITLKAHFRIESAKILASEIYGLAPEAIKDSQGLDFVREVCNLVAGNVKMALADQGVVTEISLPISMRGWEEYFFDAQKTGADFKSWGVNTGKAALCFSSAMESLGTP